MILFAIDLIFVSSFKNGKKCNFHSLFLFYLPDCVVLVFLSLFLCVIALYHWLCLFDLSSSVSEHFCFLNLSITPCPFSSVCLVLPSWFPSVSVSSCLSIFLCYLICLICLTIFLSLSPHVFYVLSLSLSCRGNHFPRRRK